MDNYADTGDGRRGQWMQTSLGGKFYPLDPRPEEVFISDIANGLALDCRYGGQGKVDRYYSVAEHSVHMARYACRQEWPWEAVLAVLLHDAPEAWINDLPRAVKHAVDASARDPVRMLVLTWFPFGFMAKLQSILDKLASMKIGYGLLEDSIMAVVARKYNLQGVYDIWGTRIKDLDRRIVPLEKAFVHPKAGEWAYDQFQALDGVRIQGWSPRDAKINFISMYLTCCHHLNIEPEEYEI